MGVCMGHVSDVADRLRVGTGVFTLWWLQQCRTPLCMSMHLGHSGSLCWLHVLDWGRRSTYPSR